MAVVLEFDASVANAVRQALGANAAILTDASEVAAHVRDSGDPLVIIGPSVDAGVAARVTEQACRVHPSVGVIWLRRRVDTTTVLEAIRAGASDVVGESDLPSLVAASQRVMAKASSQAAGVGGSTSHGTVTAVFASKGGCGKTSLATNLAALLANELNQKVCLLDLDLESGDVQLLMNLKQGRCITDLVCLAGSLDSASLHTAFLEHSSGAAVMAAPKRPEEAAEISPELVTRIVEIACADFDHVIIDCPPYATEHVLSVLDLADHLALICTPDAASVKNTALALEMLDELNFAGTISLIINKAGERVGITTADIAHALNFEVAAEIPASLDMPTATNSGKLLSLADPRHPISAALRGWAQGINSPAPALATSELHVVSAPERAPAKRSLLKLKRVSTA